MNIRSLGVLFTLALAYIVAYHSTSSLAPFVLVGLYAAFAALDMPDFENGSFKDAIIWLLAKPILVAASATFGLITVALKTGSDFHAAYIALGVGIVGLFLIANLFVFSSLMGKQLVVQLRA
ncbi:MULTISPECIES: hypothetical protein [Paracoccaceae]|uniref:hypothetical protein n=1 Tax=Paracoccaceae TaxID=31989 RepID=UPI003298FB1E